MSVRNRSKASILSLAVFAASSFFASSAALCSAFAAEYCFSNLSTTGVRQKALQAARTAVKLDDKDSFAHMALGRTLSLNRARQESIYELELAIGLNPNSAQAHSHFGIALVHCDQAERAIDHMKLAMRLSPSDPEKGPFHTRLAGAHFF